MQVRDSAPNFCAIREQSRRLYAPRRSYATKCTDGIGTCWPGRSFICRARPRNSGLIIRIIVVIPRKASLLSGRSDRRNRLPRAPASPAILICISSRSRHYRFVPSFSAITDLRTRFTLRPVSRGNYVASRETGLFAWNVFLSIRPQSLCSPASRALQRIYREPSNEQISTGVFYLTRCSDSAPLRLYLVNEIAAGL